MVLKGDPQIFLILFVYKLMRHIFRVVASKSVLYFGPCFKEVELGGKEFLKQMTQNLHALLLTVSVVKLGHGTTSSKRCCEIHCLIGQLRAQ